MTDKSSSGYIKKKRGRKATEDTEKREVRKQHKVYFTDKECDIVTCKAKALDMDRSVYIREVALGYKPVKPDREFRRELMTLRDDLKKFFAFVSTQRWSKEERIKKLSDVGFLNHWAGGIKKELDFLNRWIKRL